MINLDQEIARRIDSSWVPDGLVCYVGTASKEGEPDIGPKGSMMVFDEQSLAFWERSHRTTLKNLEENPKVVVVYRNPEKSLQWRFHGVATIHKEGAIKDQVMARTVQIELDRDPDRKGVAVVIRVDKMMTFAGEVLQER